MNRLYNICAAFLAAPLALGIVLPLATLIVLVDHMPPLYLQRRFGKDGRSFTCVKLQTLRPTADETAISNSVRNALRLTKLGIWLRDHSLDELPQLINILAGSMSFIGPRPLHKNDYAHMEVAFGDIARFKHWQQIRQSVSLGLSGWQQIHTNGMTPKGSEYDLAYIRDPSMRKNLRVLVHSVIIMTLGKNRYFQGAELKSR